MLTDQGAKDITFVETTEQAVKIANPAAFDIYLLDYNLGSSKNGAQLLEYLKNNNLVPKYALCFIITGDSNKWMVLTAVEKTPDDYLMKPFSPVQLSTRRESAIRRKTELKSIYDTIEAKDHQLAISLCLKTIDKQPQYRSICKNLLMQRGS